MLFSKIGTRTGFSGFRAANCLNYCRRPFSSTKVEETPIEENIASMESKERHALHYMKDLLKWSFAGTTIGITSAYFGTFVPMGIPAAYLVLAGFFFELFGREQMSKSKPQLIREKAIDGKLIYSIINPPERRFAFYLVCSGTAAYSVPILSLVGSIHALLPLAGIIAISSMVGHIHYTKFAVKWGYKPASAAMFGCITGFAGLALMSLGSMTIFPGFSFYKDVWNVTTYISVLMYNLFAAYDSEKVSNQMINGKADYLKHAVKLVENWIIILAPYLLF